MIGEFKGEFYKWSFGKQLLSLLEKSIPIFWLKEEELIDLLIFRELVWLAWLTFLNFILFEELGLKASGEFDWLRL